MTGAKTAMKVVVGVTGASGSLYAVSFLRELVRRGVETHVVCSTWGEKVLAYECGLDREAFPEVIWHAPDNMFSSLASGSCVSDHMVIIPCSMNTLSCLAHGISANLLQRVGGVMLKEKRNLVLVPRELPLSVIHLENMLCLARAGALLAPACPAFYHRPQSIQDLADHLVGRILGLMGMEQDLFPPWQEPDSATLA